MTEVAAPEIEPGPSDVMDLPGGPNAVGPWTEEQDNVLRWFDEETGEKQALEMDENESLASGPYGVNGEDRENFITHADQENGGITAFMRFEDYVDANSEVEAGGTAAELDETMSGKVINGATLTSVTTDNQTGAKVLQAFDMNTRDQATIELPQGVDLRLVDSQKNGLLDQMIVTKSDSGETSVPLQDYIEAWRNNQVAELNELYTRGGAAVVESVADVDMLLDAMKSGESLGENADANIEALEQHGEIGAIYAAAYRAAVEAHPSLADVVFEINDQSTNIEAGIARLCATS